VADTSVVNLNAHLTGFRGSDFDVLIGEGRASLPGDGGLLGLAFLFKKLELEMELKPKKSRSYTELTLQVMV
jgi:hypothetical protein